jgi:hypothetical protein
MIFKLAYFLMEKAVILFYICGIVLKFYSFTFCFLFVSTSLFAQDTAKRQAKPEYRNIVQITLNYARHAPMGTMKERFGTSNSYGIGTGYKFGRNWQVNAGLDLMFGGKVKENNMFDSITGASRSMIDANGNLAVVRLYERGYMFHFDFGKIIQMDRIHKNSGLLFTGGIGMMSHKIKFQFTRNIMPQLENGLYKGYDRMSNGLMLRGFAGYQRMEPDELFSFYAGIEYLRGYTRSRRSLNYDTRLPDNRLRNDLLIGIKAGVIFTINGRKAGEKKGEEEKFYQ